MSPMVKNPSTSAGSRRWDNASPTMEKLPDSSPSSTYSPVPPVTVPARGSSRPPIGNHPSRLEKTYSTSSANQKLGMDTPLTDTPRRI